MWWYTSKRTPVNPIIGQAWMGKHVVIVQCSPTNQFQHMYKSKHAPIEPPHTNCAETLAQLLSIGYQIHAITPINQSTIQYVLTQ